MVLDTELRNNGTELSDSERDELKRLCKEVKELRMEKEILKKAAFFAKEMK
jgi:transposase